MTAVRRPIRDAGEAHFSVRRAARTLAVLFGFVFACAASPRALAQVLVVLSDESSGYQAVADELRSGLHESRDASLRVEAVVAARLAAVDAPAFDRYQLVVTVGLAAARAAVEREATLASPPRTLCLLIPRQSFEHLAPARIPGQLSALFIDQPIARQLALLHRVLPEARRVGVVLGPSSQALEGELRDEARKRALELAEARIDEASGMYGALQTVMPASDALLMLPDPVASNADSVYGLLLTAYRAERPVIGFSEGLLNAGALAALFSTARQQGREGAAIAANTLAEGGVLPPPRYPRAFTVRVNASVARSLGLHLPSAETLTEDLRRQEGNGDSAPGAAGRAGKP